MILLFGGTSDSLKIMEGLVSLNKQVVLSVATDYGQLFSDQYAGQVIKKRMNTQEMIEFIQKEQIESIVDASHPFANLVSDNAIAAAQACYIPYYRFERPREVYPDYVQCVESLDQVCDYVKQNPGRVYLTTGSKTLKDYVAQLPIESLQARVLPTSEVLAMCEQLGLRADQVDAIKGPFSQELNYQLFQKAGCQYMVTKESGSAGGLQEKIAAAHQADMTVLMIQRPQITYPNEFSDVEGLIKAVINE